MADAYNLQLITYFIFCEGGCEQILAEHSPVVTDWLTLDKIVCSFACMHLFILLSIPSRRRMNNYVNIILNTATLLGSICIQVAIDDLDTQKSWIATNGQLLHTLWSASDFPNKIFKLSTDSYNYWIYVYTTLPEDQMNIAKCMHIAACQKHAYHIIYQILLHNWVRPLPFSKVQAVRERLNLLLQK